MRLINILALVILFIFALHAAGTVLNWYNQIWWFDIPMHIMGGAFLALLFFYVFTDRSKLFGPQTNFGALFFAAIGFVALLGILWEFYEYLVYVFVVHQIPFGGSIPGIHFDTLKDLFDDLCGGVVATLAYGRTAMRRLSR